MDATADLSNCTHLRGFSPGELTYAGIIDLMSRGGDAGGLFGSKYSKLIKIRETVETKGPVYSRRTNPMDLKTRLQAKRADILALAAKHGAYDVRLFGSVGRGEAGPESDVDILINLESGRSLLDQIALGQDLEDLLGCKVDVVTEAALHWYIRDKILHEAAQL